MISNDNYNKWWWHDKGDCKDFKFNCEGYKANDVSKINNHNDNIKIKAGGKESIIDNYMH